MICRKYRFFPSRCIIGPYFLCRAIYITVCCTIIVFYFTTICIWNCFDINDTLQKYTSLQIITMTECNIMLRQIDIMCYTILNHSLYYVYSFSNQVRNLRKTFKDTSTITFKPIFLLQIQYHWQYLKIQSLLRFYLSIPRQILTLGYLQWDWRNSGNGFDLLSGPWMDVRMSMVST